MPRILVSAGDYSADQHGESLLKEIKALDSSVRITALGGGKIKNVADEFLRDMVDMDISGFSQPVKQFFSLKNILQKTVFPRIRAQELDAVILIDYYDFNIFIAEKAQSENIPVFYFISPQVWASRSGRIQKLKNCVTRMLVIFPFEEELYRRHGVPATFVGHPLMDVIPEQKNPAEFRNRSPNSPISLGLLPGSRRRELIRHIPLMLNCAGELKKSFSGLETTLFAVDFIPDDFYRTAAGHGQPESSNSNFNLVRETDFRKRSELAFSITASGTATLENALLGIPMIVVYKTSWLTYWIAKKIIRVPYISLPNLLAQKEIVPELIQENATPKALLETAARFLSTPDLLEKMRAELIQLRGSLGAAGVYRRAAKIILEGMG